MSIKGRVKPDARRKAYILLGGMAFTKDTWTEVPDALVSQATKHHSDILDLMEFPNLEVQPEEAPVSEEEAAGSSFWPSPLEEDAADADAAGSSEEDVTEEPKRRSRRKKKEEQEPE